MNKYTSLNYLKTFKAYQLKSVIKQWKQMNPQHKIKSWKNASKNKLIEIITSNNIDLSEYDIPKSNPNPYKRPITDARKKYGKKSYNESEQEAYLLNLSNDPRYKNPLQPLDKYVNKEGKKEYLSLEKHQIDFIKQFIFSNLRGAIAFHGVGSGKTLNAVVASYYYLKMYPNNKVIVISPSSLLFNFTNGMVQYGLDVSDNRYNFYTYDKYIRNPKLGKDALIIIDEAHNFRTEIKKNDIMDDQGLVIDQIPTSNIRGFKVMKYATEHAHKVLLLTGTVFVNSLYDIENLLAMVDNRSPIDKSTYGEMLADPSNISDYFKSQGS
jgi:hypothetical protein